VLLLSSILEKLTPIRVRSELVVVLHIVLVLIIVAFPIFLIVPPVRPNFQYSVIL
jgi:hypothetical protein